MSTLIWLIFFLNHQVIKRYVWGLHWWLVLKNEQNVTVIFTYCIQHNEEKLETVCEDSVINKHRHPNLFNFMTHSIQVYKIVWCNCDVVIFFPLCYLIFKIANNLPQSFRSLKCLYLLFWKNYVLKTIFKAVNLYNKYFLIVLTRFMSCTKRNKNTTKRNKTTRNGPKRNKTN